MSNEQRAGFPIHRWKLKNFKSVEDADVELAPLTILVGPNSSGKSSLLQSILLIAQAAQEGPAPWLPLNGPLVELGGLQDIIFAGRSSRENSQPSGKRARAFSIGAQIEIDVAARPSFIREPTGAEETSVLSWEALFGPTKNREDLGVAGLLSTKLRFHLDGEGEDVSFETKGFRQKKLVVFSGGRYESGLGEVLPLRGVLSERQRERRRRSSRLISTDTHGKSSTRKIAGLVQVGGIPIQYFVEVNRTDLEAREILERLERQYVRRFLKEELPSGGMTERSKKGLEAEIARQIVEAMTANDTTTGRSKTISRASQELGRFFMEMNYHQAGRILKRVAKVLRSKEKVLAAVDRKPGYLFGIERFGNSLASFMARKVRYLGPLREDPRIVYLPTPAERDGNVGKKGEKAVALLHAHGKDPIKGFFPDDRAPESCTLAEGLKVWLNYFGIAEAIETKLRPRLGLESHLNLPDVDRPLDMTAVGVGVSQIFPVLVMGLHAKPGSVLLMEQPELHLHPALQQRLGDFLLACARSGRQLIVETHSDHLISRLRRRIAEDETNRLHESLAIIFAERQEGRTTYRQIQVNRFGGIEEWPKGFFDQAARESQLLLRAGLAKKQQETQKSG